MRTIWKFPFVIDDEFIVSMPKGAEVVHIGLQNDQPYLWAIVDPKAKMRDHVFAARGTGHPISENLMHIATLQMSGVMDGLVFHIFRQLPRSSNAGEFH